MPNNLGNERSEAVVVWSFAFVTVWILEVQSLTLEIHYLAV